MQNKNYLTVATLVFSIIAVGHALRVLFSWPAQIGTWTVPLWLSGLVVLVAGYLAFLGYKLMKK